MTKVAFLGPRGTYTHQAIIQQFGEDIEIYPQSSIEQCFKIIDSKDVHYSVVPFENSTNGQVVFTYDLIRDWYFHNPDIKFKIVGEQYVAIHHNLLSKQLDIKNITKIYSHPQVWGQVGEFLATLPSSITKRDVSSTSKAAELVSRALEPVACISSAMCSKLYNLPIIKPNIEDNKRNTTRFLILGYYPLPDNSGKWITSILFTMKEDYDQKSGSLVKLLMSFDKHNVNLININSRPSKSKNWHYAFFVDLEGNYLTDDNLKQALKELKQGCSELVILGEFQRALTL